MSFSDRAKAVALAIVKIFETGKALGDYSAVAVLADGAGISYGISQFTHGSGSLALVIRRYAKLGGEVAPIIMDALPDFTSGRDIVARSRNSALKKALAEAGEDPLMQQAQREIGYENYLNPALLACEGSDFVFPLSLAVVYDSKNQGGYETVRDRTHVIMPGNGSMKPEEFEKEWITEYCRQRRRWLKGSRKPIVRATDYRPEFFLGEIEKGNWQLDTPLRVHGHRLTESMLFPKVSAVDTSTSDDPESQPSGSATPGDQANGTSPEAQPQPPATETIEMHPPSKEGATAASARMTILGITVPPTLYAIFQAVGDWIEKGYIDVKQIIEGLGLLLKDNYQYVFGLIGVLIGFLAVKKVLKQITFLFSMWTAANPNWNTVKLVQKEDEPPAAWWQIWK